MNEVEAEADTGAGMGGGGEGAAATGGHNHNSNNNNAFNPFGGMPNGGIIAGMNIPQPGQQPSPEQMLSMMQSLLDNPTMMRQVLQMSIESYPQLQQMINSLATYSTTVRYYLYCHSMTLCVGVGVGVCVGVYFLYVPFCTHSSLLSLYLFVFTCIHSIVDSRSGSE